MWKQGQIKINETAVDFGIKDIKKFETNDGIYKVIKNSNGELTIINPYGIVCGLRAEYLEYLITSGQATVKE